MLQQVKCFVRHFIEGYRVKWDWLGGSTLAVIVLMACTLAPSTARSEDCPAPNRLERLEAPEARFWLMLCIPPGNDLYRVKHGRLDLFWRGDLQVPQPAGYDTAQLGVDPGLTVATVGLADHNKADAILGPMTASILKAAEAKSGNGTFDADVLFNGHVFPISFETVDGGLFKGTYSAIELGNTSEIRTMTLLLRPNGVNGRPHLAMCGMKEELHVCTAFASAAGKEIVVMVANDTVDRLFRLSEEIVGKLNAFAVLPKAP